MLSLAKQCAFEEPSVETISGENVLTWPHVVGTLVLLPLFTLTALWEICRVVSIPLSLIVFSFMSFLLFTCHMCASFESQGKSQAFVMSYSSIYGRPTNRGPLAGMKLPRYLDPKSLILLVS